MDTLLIQETAKKSPYFLQIIETFDDLIEEHRISLGKEKPKDEASGRRDANRDEDIFLTTIFLYLEAKGFDTEEFGSELIELSKRTNKLDLKRRL